MQLNEGQQAAHDRIIQFCRESWQNWASRESRHKLLTFGGYAGAGKTSTIGEVARTIKEGEEQRGIAFCTYAAKASLVLKSKLGPFLDENIDYCGTIHGLIYNLIGQETCKRTGKITPIYELREDGGARYDLIVLDEASMVGRKVFSDLARQGIPILAVGDHAQLPPVDPKATEPFNLMSSPQIRLERVMRQAQGHPIVKMSMHVRRTGAIPYGEFGTGVYKTFDGSHINRHKFSDPESMALCATNRTRCRINAHARGGFDHPPEPGERVVCLYNNWESYVLNGMIGTVLECRDAAAENPYTGQPMDVYRMKMDMGDFVYEGLVSRTQFGKERNESKVPGVDLFDYASCLSVWRAQGSEWDHVTFYDENAWWLDEDQKRRMRYTAVTRAKKTLRVISLTRGNR